jgi:DNA-directed RNA polymerase omega subunit
LDEDALRLSLEKVPDRERLVNLAARRAKELARGAHPLIVVDRQDRNKYLDIALREIADGKIVYEAAEADA